MKCASCHDTGYIELAYSRVTCLDCPQAPPDKQPECAIEAEAYDIDVWTIDVAQMASIAVDVQRHQADRLLLAEVHAELRRFNDIMAGRREC
jgi:hypothetical protein